MYRPRMSARITVPIFRTTFNRQAEAVSDEPFVYDIPIRAATLIRNDHAHADELVIDGEWRDMGIDPRFVKSATIEFWAGDAGNTGLVRDDSTLRFAGIATNVRREAKEGSGYNVSITFQDYTHFFLNQKLADEYVPDFSDTLDKAWRKICRGVGFMDPKSRKIVSSVNKLADKLTPSQKIIDQGGKNILVGANVPDRFRSFGRVQAKDGDNAWAIWSRCVGMHGFLTFFEEDKLIVTTTTEHWKADKSPLFMWGENLTSVDESSDTKATNGIGLTSYDPNSGKVIEAFYPPAGSPLIHIKRSVAQRQKGQTGTVSAEQTPHSDNYDIFEYNDPVTLEALKVIAQCAYEERARLQLEGNMKTSEMSVAFLEDKKNKDARQVLDVRAGDPITVFVDFTTKEALQSRRPDLKDYLVNDRGYNKTVADLLIANSESIISSESLFHVKQLTANFKEDSFDVEIQYQNMIDVKGNAKKGDQAVAPSSQG